MWGRGTCDMKGGLAAIFGAVAAIAAAGVSLRKPLAVHTVVGEEDGGARRVRDAASAATPARRV